MASQAEMIQAMAAEQVGRSFKYISMCICESMYICNVHIRIHNHSRNFLNDLTYMTVTCDYHIHDWNILQYNVYLYFYSIIMSLILITTCVYLRTTVLYMLLYKQVSNSILKSALAEEKKLDEQLKKMGDMDEDDFEVCLCA